MAPLPVRQPSPVLGLRAHLGYNASCVEESARSGDSVLTPQGPFDIIRVREQIDSRQERKATQPGIAAMRAGALFCVLWTRWKIRRVCEERLNGS